MTSKSGKKSLKKPQVNESTAAEVIPPSAVEQRQGRVLKMSWQGPYPPPDVMKQYDDVVPNGAERLFLAFEEETKHRREMERLSLGFQGRDLVIGKVFALLFTICVLLTIAYAIANDSPWVAAVLGAGMLTTIAVGFFRIYGDSETKKPHEESDPKNQSSSKDS